MNILLNRKTVKINNFEREVALKIEGNKMFGVLNKTRFVWIYTEHELPNVETKEGVDKLKAAKYGRLYILKRLEMEGIKLNIKEKEKTVEYMHIPEKDGVWINAFENGYLRGCVNGVAFSWNPALYKMAVAVNAAGFDGAITKKIDTNKIKARLRDAGYTNYSSLMKAVKDNAGSTNVDPFSCKDVSEKYVYVENTENITVKLHHDKSITGTINGKDFSWNSKLGVSNLPDDARNAIKKQGFNNMALLVEFYSPILESPNLNLINSVTSLLSKYEDLNETAAHVQECYAHVSDMKKLINNNIDWIEECIDVYGENKSAELQALNSALDLINAQMSLDAI